LLYSALLWWNPASRLSFHVWRGIVVVFSFAVAVSCFALIFSRLAWYHCGIWLHCGSILLSPYLFTSGMVSLRYSASLSWYPAEPLSLHTRCGIIAVFGFAVAVSCFALISLCLAWYRCGIQLCCGSILLRPYLLLVLTGGCRSAGSRR